MPITFKEKEIVCRSLKDLLINATVSEGWKNFTKNIDLPETLVIDIADRHSLQELCKLITEINRIKHPSERIIARCAAGHPAHDYAKSYSLTPGSKADIIIRLTGQEFKQVTTFLDDKSVVRVGASMQIGELDQLLYESHDLSLATSSLIPYVTIAGLATNGGHGTGKEQPSFAGLIKGMTLCLPNGEIVHIDEKDPRFAIMRGANLGVFGFILDVDIECRPAQKMQCVMEARSVPEFIREVRAGLFLHDPYVSVMMIPTYNNELANATNKNVIIYRWRPVDKTVRDTNTHIIRTHIGQEIEIKLEEGLRITDLLRKFPGLIPPYTRYLVCRAVVGERDSIAVGPWYMVHNQTAFPTDIDDADYLFHTNTRCEQLINAIEKIFTTLEKYSKKHLYPIVDAIYVRLFEGQKGHHHGLSNSVNPGDGFICGLDMVSSVGISGYTEFKQDMREYFLHGPLKAKPHWGKYIPESEDYAKMYGSNLQEFIDVLADWYQSHHMSLEKSFLLNKFLCDILQLPYVPNVILSTSLKKFAGEADANTCEIARQLYAVLAEDESEEAKTMRKMLLPISRLDKQYSDQQTLFGKSETDDEATQHSRATTVIAAPPKKVSVPL